MRYTDIKIHYKSLNYDNFKYSNSSHKRNTLLIVSKRIDISVLKKLEMK